MSTNRITGYGPGRIVEVVEPRRQLLCNERGWYYILFSDGSTSPLMTKKRALFAMEYHGNNLAIRIHSNAPWWVRWFGIGG